MFVSNRKALAGSAAYDSLAALVLSGLLRPGVILSPRADATTTARVEEMRERAGGLSQQIEDAWRVIDERDGNPTNDETQSIEGLTSDLELLNRQITAREQSARLIAGGGRRTAPEPGAPTQPASGPTAGSRSAPAGGQPRTPAQPRVDAGKWGFRTLGEMAIHVRKAAFKDEGSVTRLSNASAYGNETTGADGGFAVPPDFKADIMKIVAGEGSLLDLTDKQTTSSNNVSFPIDETSPWGAAGIQAFWEGEANQIPRSKPQLSQSQTRLNKLTALVGITEELLEDAAGIDSWLRSKVPEVFTAKVNTAIIAGSGIGMPKGILASAGCIVVPAEASQPADTILFANIVKMMSRVISTSVPRIVWLANSDILPQLYTMQFSPGSSTPVPVWLPANGLAGQPFSTLMGKPVMTFEALPTLGDQGDLILADLSAYMSVLKVGAASVGDLRVDTSMHFEFDRDVVDYRFVLRMAGQPYFNQPVQPQNGSLSKARFVALADRP